MSLFTRRSFLELSSAAVCAVPPAAAPQPSPAKPPARVYAVFCGIAPSTDDTDLRPVTNQEIVRRLEKQCEGVEFTVRDLTRGAKLPEILNEVKDLNRLNYDGVLLYGWPRDNEILRSGLPTIQVAVLNDFMNIPYPQFRQNRVASAFLDPWRFSADPAVSEKMFDDLADKIKLIRMLKRMKSEHILTVTDSQWFSVVYGDMLKQPAAPYNEKILGAIGETFGTKVTKIGTKEVTGDGYIRKLWDGDSKEASEIARRWMREAEKMTYTLESEVVRSAKVYLAMKHLMGKYGATAMAFHIRTLVPSPRPQDAVFPALATSEFQLHNTVAKCQSHLNILLSEMIVQYAYGRPSMLGDYAVDPYHKTSSVQHCEGPWNPWGGSRRVPYILTDHRERRVRARKATGGGAASWVLYPADEPVTMWQVEVLSKEVLVHTGRTVPILTGPVQYRDHLWEMM